MIRSIIFNIAFWPVFAGYITIAYPFALFFSQKQATVVVYRKIAKWMLFCLKHISGVGYEVRNIDVLREQLKKGVAIIGCNHQSAWETFAFAVIFDEVATVIKKELLRIPIAGTYFKKLGCIPIDRASPISAIRGLLKYGKIAREKKQSILIFPNGTRSSASEHVEFKSGIFALYNSLKIPVIPAAVNSGKCWPRRSFKKKKGTIILDFKSPILPGLSKEDFMERFEKSMREVC